MSVRVWTGGRVRIIGDKKWWDMLVSCKLDATKDEKKGETN